MSLSGGISYRGSRSRAKAGHAGSRQDYRRRSKADLDMDSQDYRVDPHVCLGLVALRVNEP